jgi:hypothetical protein
MDDGWSIEWTEPTDEMHVDIAEPLSRHTDDLVAIRRRVRQKTDPVPWFRTRVYRCQRCGTEQRTEILHRSEDIVRGITRTPHECEVEGCQAGESHMETVNGSSTYDFGYSPYDIYSVLEDHGFQIKTLKDKTNQKIIKAEKTIFSIHRYPSSSNRSSTACSSSSDSW